MANNHEQFKAFHDVIKATSTRRKTLKTNRDALRAKIRKYFKDNHSDYIQPTFYWQGSFASRVCLALSGLTALGLNTASNRFTMSALYSL